MFFKINIGSYGRLTPATCFFSCLPLTQRLADARPLTGFELSISKKPSHRWVFPLWEILLGGFAMLDRRQLSLVLQWASQQSAKSGTLLERAREVLRLGTAQKYGAKVEYASVWYGVVVSHSCGCPSWKASTPCKHVMAILLLDHREILSTSPKWAQFFASLPRFGGGSPPSSGFGGSSRGGSPSRGGGPRGGSPRSPRGGSRRGPSVPPDFGNF